MASVPTRTVGSAGLTLPMMALGSWHTWSRARFEDVVTIVRDAVDTGASMFDVGVYRADFDGSDHDSPTDIVLARALQVAGIRREDYTLSIKGWLMPASGETLAEQADEVLLRHGADSADLMVLGGIVDEAAMDADALVARLGELISSGRIRHWGLNNWSARQIDLVTEAAARAGVEAPQLAQMVYGLAHRTVVEGEPYRDAQRRTGLALQASDIFDGGRLLGKNARHTGGDVGGVRPRVEALRDRMAGVASGLGMSLAQFCFAYPLTNPDTANVLVGVSRPEQFEELAAVYGLLAAGGAERVRAAADEFWLDRDSMDPEGEAA